MDEHRRTHRPADVAHLGFFVRYAVRDSWIPVAHTRVTLRDIRREGEDTLV